MFLKPEFCPTAEGGSLHGRWLLITAGAHQLSWAWNGLVILECPFGSEELMHTRSQAPSPEAQNAMRYADGWKRMSKAAR